MRKRRKRGAFLSVTVRRLLRSNLHRTVAAGYIVRIVAFDDHLHVRRDFTEKLDRYMKLTQLFQRFVQRDFAAVDLVALLCQLRGDIRRGD